MTAEDEPKVLALALALAAALYLLSWHVAGPPYGPSAPVDAGPASDRPPTLAGSGPDPAG